MALILWVLGLCIARSQETRTEMYVNFRVDSHVIDPEYLDNSECLDDIRYFLQTVREDPSVNLLEISLCGAASPEGSDQLNSRLAKLRLKSLEQFIRDEIDVPDGLISYNYEYIPWEWLREQVECSELRYRDEILEILDEEPRLVNHHYPGHKVDHRVLKLKQLDRGSAWLEMYQQFFGRMRGAYVVFVTEGGSDYADYHHDNPVLIPESIHDLARFMPSRNTWGGQRFYLKTNAVNWALGMTNVALEADLVPHWSLNLPLSYSAWNYFKSTTKFRFLFFQPEVRYWVDSGNYGFFAGAHLGVSSYNLAFGGEYRYQDHNGATPAFGGGVSLGYRIPLGHNGHWWAEFSLGAGAYRLHYDVFNNTPDVKDGTLVSTERLTYVGLDQASVSFSYSFDLRRKGGKR